MDLSKKSLKALRRVRDKQRISMAMLFTTIGVLREACVPYIPSNDIEGAVKWFLSLTSETQTKLIDDAMGVNNQ